MIKNLLLSALLSSPAAAAAAQGLPKLNLPVLADVTQGGVAVSHATYDQSLKTLLDRISERQGSMLETRLKLREWESALKYRIRDAAGYYNSKTEAELIDLGREKYYYVDDGGFSQDAHALKKVGEAAEKIEELKLKLQGLESEIADLKQMHKELLELIKNLPR